MTDEKNKLNGKSKYQLLFLVGIFACLLFLILLWWFYWDGMRRAQEFDRTDTNKIPAENAVTATTTDSGWRAKINGEKVAQEEMDDYPVAVMIDNQAEARPNYGLSEASVVYETLIEGGATRLMAIFAEGKSLEKIGPVRSARPYFVEMAEEYDALYAHAGGSVDALQKIKDDEVHDLEEIAWWGPDYFWRVYSRPAPHNLFTSSDNLEKALVDWKLEDKETNYGAWLFMGELNNEINYSAAEKLSVCFSDMANYRIDWEYNEENENYERFQGGDKHVDGLNNQQIEASTIIIQFVPSAEVLDAVGRLEMNLAGRGKAWILRDGVVIKGNWEKNESTIRTKFYSQGKQEVFLKPGLIWVEIVPVDRKVEVK